MQQFRRLSVRARVATLLLGIGAVALFGVVESVPVTNAEQIRSSKLKLADRLASSLGLIALAGLSGAAGVGLLVLRVRRSGPSPENRLAVGQTLGFRNQVTICEIEWGHQRLLVAVSSTGCELLSSTGFAAAVGTDSEKAA